MDSERLKNCGTIITEKYSKHLFQQIRERPIDIKFTDRIGYYNAFDEYHGKNNLKPMETLFAKYLIERLDMYLRILK